MLVQPMSNDSQEALPVVRNSATSVLEDVLNGDAKANSMTFA
jgi:hypothetical protein